MIADVGLCIALHDILSIGEAHLFQGNAAQHTAVEFRLVVFRPLVGQILTGKVASCDQQGVRISLGFFDDIQVPVQLLPTPSSWSDEESLWMWNIYDDNPLFVDLENQARFRVVQVTYRRQDGAHAQGGTLSAVF